MKKLITLVFILAGLSTTLFGSATIFKEDGGDSVVFAVNVEADVYIDGHMLGEVRNGSFSYQFPRNERGAKTVVFKKEGFRDAAVVIRRDMDIVILGNVFLFYSSSSGTTTDFATGNYEKHTPNQYMIFMQKAD